MSTTQTKREPQFAETVYLTYDAYARLRSADGEWVGTDGESAEHKAIIDRIVPRPPLAFRSA